MAQVVDYVSNSDRRKPVFVVCGKCKMTARRLHFQGKTNKYNPVNMAFCPICKVFTKIGDTQILNNNGDLIKCA